MRLRDLRVALMRRSAAAATAAATAVVAAALAVPGLANHSDLAAQWHLDEKSGDLTLDSSGHENHGRVNADSQIVPGGRFGGAYDPGDPLDAVIDVSDSPTLESQRLTVLAWVRNDGAPGPGVKYVIAKGSAGCAGASYSINTRGGGGVRFSVFDGGATRNSPESGTAIWDDKWHAVAGTYDGSSLRLYVDAVQVGSGTPMSGTVAYGLSFEDLKIGGYPGSGACGGGLTWPGQIDEPRVYTRALSGAEIAFLQDPNATSPPVLPPGGLPDPGPGPQPQPQPAPGPQPQPGAAAPRVSGLRPVGAFKRDRAVVLEAQVSGRFQTLAWDLRGDSRPEIVSGAAAQTSVRFRPRPGKPFDVSVQAFGPGGESPIVTQSFTAPPALRNALSDRLRPKAARLDPTDVVGPAENLVEQVAKLRRCADQSKLKTGLVEVEGCFFPIDALKDIPVAERGIVEQLGRFLSLRNRDGESIPAKLVDRSISLTDAYISPGPVTINGVTLDPQGKATVVLYPQVNAIASSDAAFSAGQLKLGARRDFVLDTRANGGRIPLESFPRLPGGIASFGGFPLVGDVGVTLVPGSAVGPAGAEITATVQLPKFLSVGGGRLEGRVKLRATAAEGLIVDNLRIGPLDANLGALDVEALQLDYTRAANQWAGQGKACVISGACLDLVPPNGGVVIRNGNLNFAGATLGFPPPGVQLFPGVALQRIGFGLGLDPTRLTGNARVSALQFYEIDGRIFIAFPSERTPFVFDRNLVGDGYPGDFYGRVHTRTTVGASADSFVKVPALGRIKLGNGYFLYEYPGYVAFGGRVNQGFAGVLSFEGGMFGEFNLGNGRFNIGGNVRTCLLDIFCRGAAGVISSRGLAACVKVKLPIKNINIGAGIIYRPFKFYPWPLDGCKWSPFAEPNVRGSRAATAQVGSPHTVRIDGNDLGRAIRIDGTDGAPRVRVTGPGGEVLESSPGPGLEVSKTFRIIRSERAKLTVVGLQDPRPGAYEIEPLPGSPPIAKVTEATDQPDAKVTAKVSGRGARRILSYDIRRRRAQRVTFVEIAAGGAVKAIGAVEGGGKGKLRFSPAPGRGVRRIEAQFELAGMPAEKRFVARFAPPSPRLGKPKRLKVRRRGTTLRVSWAKVAGAERYEVVTTASGERQRIRRVHGRRTTLKRLPRSSAGRITVRAVAELRQGRPARARFNRTARRETRFRPLPRAPRALR